ncbi:MAG: hypothetical protein ACREOW_05200 [Thermodesulfobacteriota bacterium]
MKQWSLFIDIEGFSKIYQAEKAKACKLLSGLMLDLYNIGTRFYPDYSNRLFIHQFGDGFIICPNPWDLNLVKPISIAVALMQATALRGGFARAAISHGEMVDILGWYPKEIRDNLTDGRIMLGDGIMTIGQVMGDALVNAYKLSTTKPKGPRLLLDISLESHLKDIKVSIIDRDDNHIGIDWVHSEIVLVADILKKIDIINVPSSKTLEGILRSYITVNNKLSDEWKKSAEKLIR